ncbi:hypothetical protein ACLKA6_017667 [Drosophila palustris]
MEMRMKTTGVPLTRRAAGCHKTRTVATLLPRCKWQCCMLQAHISHFMPRAATTTGSGKRETGNGTEVSWTSNDF